MARKRQCAERLRLCDPAHGRLRNAQLPVSFGVVRVLLTLLAAASGVPLGAQIIVRPADARTGSEAFHYLEARALDTASRGPWAEQAGAPPLLSGLSSLVSANSGLPFSRNDGPAWAGRGMNAQFSAVGFYRRGGLTVRIAPVAWIAQNVEYSLVPPSVLSPPSSPFADPQRPRTIDLPQRFGDEPLGRLDPGESELSYERWRLRAALTSGARHLGAGARHAILMQGDAPGFARFEMSTPQGIRTPLGTFSAVLAAGKIGQTVWAPLRREGARSGSFIEGRWRPFHSDRVELGGARFYHRDWKGIRLADFTAPFSVFFYDWTQESSGETDNQLIVLFGSVKVPEAGLAFWAEFGRNDGARDLRDFTAELEHNSAWMFGLQKVWRDAGDRLWSLEATGASARIPPIIRFRPQASFYDHFPMRQGHTNRGQLLGSPLMEREGGGELRIDRYDPLGRVGLILASRNLPNERAEFVDEADLRQEWSALLELLRAHPRGFHWFARAGLIADLNRHPTLGDAYNLTLSAGITLRP